MAAKTHSEQNSLALVERLQARGEALTPRELANLLSISLASVYRLRKRGLIPAYRIGTSIRFDPRGVAMYLEGKI